MIAQERTHRYETSHVTMPAILIANLSLVDAVVDRIFSINLSSESALAALKLFRGQFANDSASWEAVDRVKTQLNDTKLLVSKLSSGILSCLCNGLTVAGYRMLAWP